MEKKKKPAAIGQPRDMFLGKKERLRPRAGGNKKKRNSKKFRYFFMTHSVYNQNRMKIQCGALSFRGGAVKKHLKKSNIVKNL